MKKLLFLAGCLLLLAGCARPTRAVSAEVCTTYQTVQTVRLREYRGAAADAMQEQCCLIGGVLRAVDAADAPLDGAALWHLYPKTLYTQDQLRSRIVLPDGGWYETTEPAPVLVAALCLRLDGVTYQCFRSSGQIVDLTGWADAPAAYGELLPDACLLHDGMLYAVDPNGLGELAALPEDLEALGTLTHRADALEWELDFYDGGLRQFSGSVAAYAATSMPGCLYLQTTTDGGAWYLALSPATVCVDGVPYLTAAALSACGDAALCPMCDPLLDAGTLTPGEAVEGAVWQAANLPSMLAAGTDRSGWQLYRVQAQPALLLAIGPDGERLVLWQAG